MLILLDTQYRFATERVNKQGTRAPFNHRLPELELALHKFSTSQFRSLRSSRCNEMV